MSEQAKMLGHRWHIDLILEAHNAVSREALSLLDGLLDEILSFLNSIELVASSKIIECCFVRIEQHLVLMKVDGLRGDGILSDECANHDAEAIFGSDGLVETFVDAASRGPTRRFILLVILLPSILFDALRLLVGVVFVRYGLG